MERDKVGASVKAPENTLAYLRWTSHILSRSPGDEKRVVAFERAQCSCSSVARYRFRPSLTDAPTVSFTDIVSKDFQPCNYCEVRISL